MTEARLTRQGAAVEHTQDTGEIETRLTRQGAIVGHIQSTGEIEMRLTRHACIVLMSRPMGWDIFDDPAL